MPAYQEHQNSITLAASMKNYLDQTLGFAVLLLLLLMGLQFLPADAKVGDYPLRRMDIFSDIRTNTIATTEPELSIDTSFFSAQDTLEPGVSDSIGETMAPPPPPSVDSSIYGTVIEDYTPNQQGLSRFFAAVDSIKRGRTVRIAWYGDSFVEGDILIGDLRDTLQTLWGGQGVGFVPITSEVAQFKRTLKHQFKGWNTFSIIKKTGYKAPYGINGYAYKPTADARIQYEGASYFKNTRRWTHTRIFYSAGQTSRMNWQLQDRVSQTATLKGRPGGISLWEWEGNYPGASSFSAQFPDPDSLTLFGASLESGPGVYIDNFSVRGNSGGPLKQLRPDIMQQFDAFQQYDLIVLQVGLNAVTNGLTNIRWYQAELERTFKHLRACFPDKPILIVSVGDRGGKNGAELTTMRGVPAIVAMQRQLARQHGFLFFDLFMGMGGPETMIKFSMQRPRLANIDYTHLTHEGGRVVGLMFTNVLLAEQARAQRKQSLQ